MNHLHFFDKKSLSFHGPVFPSPPPPGLCLSSRGGLCRIRVFAGSRNGCLDLICDLRTLARDMSPSPTGLLSSVYPSPQSTLLSAASTLVPDVKASLGPALSLVFPDPLTGRRPCCSSMTLGSDSFCEAGTLCLWYPTLGCRGMTLLMPCLLRLEGWVSEVATGPPAVHLCSHLCSGA